MGPSEEDGDPLSRVGRGGTPPQRSGEEDPLLWRSGVGRGGTLGEKVDCLLCVGTPRIAGPGFGPDYSVPPRVVTQVNYSDGRC